jgi:peptide/nickel transport system substrate-binding protein
VTAQDVIFTIELMRDPTIPVPEDIRDLWDEIDIVAVNDYLIQFQLPEPLSPFLDYLTFGILPEHLLGSLTSAEIIDAKFNLQPVGSGPYRFSQFIVQEDQILGVELEAFEQYYFPRAFIDSVTFRYFSDAETALQAFNEGDIDGISQITDDSLPAALGEPGLSLYTSRLPQLTLVMFNLDNPRRPFFQETEVRQALMHALNRQRMIDQILGGQAILANGPIFPGTWAYLDANEMPEFDIQKGIELLRTAGYTIPASGGSTLSKDGEFLRFTLAYPDDAIHRQLAELIQESWLQICVDVELSPLP